MKKWLRFVLAFIIGMTILLQLFQSNDFFSMNQEVIEQEETVSLNEFLAYYESGSFAKIILTDDTKLAGYVLLEETTKPSIFPNSEDIAISSYTVLRSRKPVSTTLTDLGISFTGGVAIESEETQVSVLWKIFEVIWPIFLFLLVMVLFFKFMMPKWWAGMPFNMKIGKVSVKSNTSTKFADIAGMDEVKWELMEIVDYLKNPAKYNKIGARHPKWVLLFGQPWSGKTLLARAVAGEASVPFISASGSEFMEMLVGMWAAKVRELFNKAKSTGKAIIFIDEIDAIGKKRGGWHTGGHQEQEQTLNQILTEMDGFDGNTNIVVIAATNRPDVLDPALLRAGRFDRKIYVSRPTLEERTEIFAYYVKKKNLDKDVSIESIAKRTSGMVGADIENIVNEAALKVARDDRKSLTNADFEYALEKVLMWPEKRIKSLNEQEKKIVAYHELWHAVTAHISPHADPVEKISIVSRWQALGVTWMMPREDSYLRSKEKILDDVVSLLGGRAAEEIFFGKDSITTWASNDFERATRLITDMVAKYGMDEDIGPILYRDIDKEDYGFMKPYSEQTAELIDAKIKEYLISAYKKSKKILLERKQDIDTMASVLLYREYITKDEFEKLMEDVSYANVLLEETKKHEKEIIKKKK